MIKRFLSYCLQFFERDREALEKKRILDAKREFARRPRIGPGDDMDMEEEMRKALGGNRIVK